MRLRYLLFLPFSLWANFTPWFTGPLLAPSGLVNELKQVTWQPYLFVTNTHGVFDKHWNRRNVPDLWTVQPLLDVTYGVGSFVDIEATPAFVYQTSQGASSVRMSDTPIFVGIQALREKEGSWVPNLRITPLFILPFGQYDKLSSKKKGTDLSGQGSYQMGISFNFQKLFKMAEEDYFRLRYIAQWIFYPTPTHIQGLSFYGGARDTRGKIYPGMSYNFILSGEYTITQNWVFAFDISYLLNSHDRFSGKRGTFPNGAKAKVGRPFSQQISFAPAIEYNFNESFGLIGGVWTTLAGKNADQFYSGVFSAVITY